MPLLKTQTCSSCREPLPQEEYTPCNWGKVGQRCRTCDRFSRLKKAGCEIITRAELKAILQRQHGRCLGCQKPITISACLDHDHKTGKIRGLLCRNCNLALGNINDNPTTLRRLMAYLDTDRSKINIYLIGSLRNPRIPEIGMFLREHDYEVFDDWFASGPEADDYWQKYCTRRGMSFKEALGSRSGRNTFLFDRCYLDLCDAGILCMPGGKSAHLELGYLRGCEKPVLIFTDGHTPDRYDIMPNAATGVCETQEALIAALDNLFDRTT